VVKNGGEFRCSTVKSGKSIVDDRGKKQNNLCKRENINFHLRSGYYVTVDKFLPENHCSGHNVYKGNNKITELQTILQRKSQNS
jgi:hypothetical protein